MDNGLRDEAVVSFSPVMEKFQFEVEKLKV